MIVYKVYWTVDGHAFQQGFDKDGMKKALDVCEVLRKRQYAGADIRFITLCSEHPDSVGKQGVDVTGPEYDWKKRRV